MFNLLYNTKEKPYTTVADTALDTQLLLNGNFTLGTVLAGLNKDFGGTYSSSDGDVYISIFYNISAAF